MKLIKKLKENYIYYNVTILLLSIYVIFFPFISKLLSAISPAFTQCAYLQITGKYCPLCGGTRYIQNIGQIFNDITYLFNFFGIVIIINLIEIVFRIICIIKIRSGKNMKKIIKYDIILHIILIITFLLYEIIFILNN